MAGKDKITIHIKKLKVKSRKVKEESACLAEMVTLLNCWASVGIDNSKCKSPAKVLATCMVNPPRPAKVKDDTNFHLARLGKHI